MTNQERLELLAASQAELATARAALNDLDAKILKQQQSIGVQEKALAALRAADGSTWVSQRAAAESYLPTLRDELARLADDRAAANARVLTAVRAVVQYGGVP